MRAQQRSGGGGAAATAGTWWECPALTRLSLAENPELTPVGARAIAAALGDDGATRYNANWRLRLLELGGNEANGIGRDLRASIESLLAPLARGARRRRAARYASSRTAAAHGRAVEAVAGLGGSSSDDDDGGDDGDEDDGAVFVGADDGGGARTVEDPLHRSMEAGIAGGGRSRGAAWLQQEAEAWAIGALDARRVGLSWVGKARRSSHVDGGEKAPAIDGSTKKASEVPRQTAMAVRRANRADVGNKGGDGDAVGDDDTVASADEDRATAAEAVVSRDDAVGSAGAAEAAETIEPPPVVAGQLTIEHASIRGAAALHYSAAPRGGILFPIAGDDDLSSLASGSAAGTLSRE